MPKLMSQEIILPGVVQKTFLHTDGRGNDNITVQSVQDVEPIMRSVERDVDRGLSKELPLVAKIPAVVVEETARECAKAWGVPVKKVFEEILASDKNQTDRAKAFWAVLCQSRDYSKFQAKNY